MPILPLRDCSYNHYERLSMLIDLRLNPFFKISTAQNVSIR